MFTKDDHDFLDMLFGKLLSMWTWKRLTWVMMIHVVITLSLNN